MKSKQFEDKIKRFNVVIVSHIFSSGPALDLEEYLKDKVTSLLFIGHPFSFSRDIRSFYRLYKRGKFESQSWAFCWRIPTILLYIKDVFYTLWWVPRHAKSVDVYIGSDNFSAFLGLILQRLGKVKRVILYTIDYVPRRFDNLLLNSLYHFFDTQCLQHCSIIWNVSPVMVAARQAHTGIPQERCTPQLHVPLGVWYDRIPRVPFGQRQKYQLVFLGHLLEKQGLDIVIRAMPQLVKKIPRIKLVIMGSGEYETILQKLTKRLQLQKHVVFTGYVEHHEDVERWLAISTVAVAMYKPDPTSFTNWADPAKIKNYLAAGLPVVLTSVPPVATEVEEQKCGFIADYNPQNFSAKVERLLQNRKLLRMYSLNALRWSKQYDWNRIFLEALEKSFELRRI